MATFSFQRRVVQAYLPLLLLALGFLWIAFLLKGKINTAGVQELTQPLFVRRAISIETEGLQDLLKNRIILVPSAQFPLPEEIGKDNPFVP
ncbi:MAG: hypothetical protein HYW95_02230 [Candidatus Wildermuthbacteria bacterium]|nr:hypothetical protein [Candidatus Wildermuthbacteria bacterium]